MGLELAHPVTLAIARRMDMTVRILVFIWFHLNSNNTEKNSKVQRKSKKSGIFYMDGPNGSSSSSSRASDWPNFCS